VSFIAPHIPSGQHFSVKTFDRTSRTWHDIPSRYDTQTATVTAEVSHFCIIALFSEMGGLTPDPSGSLVTAGQSNPEDSPAQFLLRSPALVFPMIMDLIVKNGFVILGILIITGAIFLRTRKPRRYRVRYEK